MSNILEIDNYKRINAEMSKKIATLKRENTKNKNETKSFIIQSIQDQNEIKTLKQQLADLKKIYIEHAKALTNEIQKFIANKNRFTDVIKTEIFEHSSIKQSASAYFEGSRRLSRSFDSPVQQQRSGSNVQNKYEIVFDTIEEVGVDSETNISQKSHTQIQSRETNVSSIGESTLISNLEASTTSPSDVIFVTNSVLTPSNSIDSNKENQLLQSSKMIEYFAVSSPLNNVVTNRHRRENVNNHSYEDLNMSGPRQSSTPYKRHSKEAKNELSSSFETETEPTILTNTKSKSKETHYTGKSSKAVESANTRSTQSNGSKDTDAKAVELHNARPKRKVSAGITYVQPKLNTKLRRPLSMERNYIGK